MPRITITIAVLHIIYDFIASDVPINCSPENVQRCWSYVEDSIALKQVVPCLNKSALMGFCRMFDYFDKCFSLVKNDCLAYVKFTTLVNLQGHQNGFSYLCKDTFEEYLTYQQCFDNYDLQLDANVCNDTLSVQLKRIQNETDKVTATNQICRAGDLYLGCIDNNVKVMCQEAAANWMNNYNRKVLSPLLSSLPCNGWTSDVSTPTTDNSMTVSLAICLSLICIVIAILVIILICHLKPQLRTSLPTVMNVCKIFPSHKHEAPCPPPYAVDSDPSSQPTEQQEGEQTGTTRSDEGSFSSGYFSTADRSPEECTQRYFCEAGPAKINGRVGSAEVISFSTSGRSTRCKTMRSHSAECTPELPRFLHESLSISSLRQSSTITPPLFEPPVANPFTPPAVNLPKDDPIITDYYC